VAGWLAIASFASPQKSVRGTPKADTLVGTDGKDRIYGFAGADWIRGLGGADVIVGGPGVDTLAGGPGNDQLLARDKGRDKIFCGGGKDRAVVDANDSVFGDCEDVERPVVEDPPLPPPSGQSIIQDRSWTCTGKVDLDVVKITLRAGSEASDAVYLRKDCSGLIRRIEIETWVADGIKINAPAPAAHDLLIGGGYIRCFDHLEGAHQDGVQVLGGERITFRNVEINCNSNPNAQFFVTGTGGGMPTDVLCDKCFLGRGAGSTISIGESLRSGVRNSLVCRGRFRPLTLTASAVEPVLTGNTILPEGDRRCV
jgi:hypothetical protein